MMKYDVCVVGGGPAGSTAATLIAKAGYKVALLEKEIFPRHQIGESLLPATIVGICSILGIQDKVYDASFYPKNGGTFIWGKSKQSWKFNFKQLDIEKVINQKIDVRAFQVERHKFDKILLDNSIDNGVDVKQNCRVMNLLEENGRIMGVQYMDEDSVSHHIKAKYVIDASGNSSRIANYAGQRVHSKHFDNVAIYGYFLNGNRLPEEDKGNILTEAFDKGWVWYIPLSDELTSVGVVLDRKHTGPTAGKVEEIYYENLKKTTKVKEFLANAKRAECDMYSKLRVRLDYSYTTTKFWNPGLVLIGDAACFVDPVFSSGVHLATFSALLAARAINSCLRGALTEELAFSEYEERYRREYNKFYNFLLAFYDVEQEIEDYFWAARKIIHSKDRDNYAFLKLISGCSSNEIHEITKMQNFSDSRKELSSVFDNSLPYKNENNQPNLGAEKFMCDLRSEIVALQASAAGLNIEQKNIIHKGLTLSDDKLSWDMAL